MHIELKPLPEPEKVNSLMHALGVDAIVAKLLVQRRVETFDEAHRFFRPKLEHLHDPFAMLDMDKAVSRIISALAQQENIMVFGDYDVDGTTAVALVSSFLEKQGAQITTYIPDRYTEGYGISFQSIDAAKADNVKLIIALDCGIKSVDHVAYAASLGIDYIICDHHRPGEVLPNAVAILDPKRADCTYPYDELCGCGIGFKLVQGLDLKMDLNTNLLPYLDLVATATAADIVPMTGENRILAHYGMAVINQMPRPGIQALLERQKKSRYTIRDVVFTVAPRINAAGRMKSGTFAVELLTRFELDEARRCSVQIEDFNTERRLLDRSITEEALEQIVANNEVNHASTVVYDPNWHKGVIGIVASKLIETHYRPTLVFTKSGDKLAASARSVKGFDLYNALEKCSEHLIQFGGHMYAAGLTMEEANYPAFKAAFEQVVLEDLKPSDREATLMVDLEVSFEELSPKTLRILKQLEPYGPENMQPLFLTRNLFNSGADRLVGTEKNHLIMDAVKERDCRETNLTYKAVGFGFGDQFDKIANQRTFDLVYAVEENEYQNTITNQLYIKHLS